MKAQGKDFRCILMQSRDADPGNCDLQTGSRYGVSKAPYGCTIVGDIKCVNVGGDQACVTSRGKAITNIGAHTFPGKTRYWPKDWWVIKNDGTLQDRGWGGYPDREMKDAITAALASKAPVPTPVPTPTPTTPAPTTPAPTTPAPTPSGGGGGGGGRPVPAPPTPTPTAPVQKTLKAQVSLAGITSVQFSTPAKETGFKQSVLSGLAGQQFCGTTNAPRLCVLNDVTIVRAARRSTTTVDFQVTVSASMEAPAKAKLNTFMLDTKPGGFQDALQKNGVVAPASPVVVTQPPSVIQAPAPAGGKTKSSSAKVWTGGMIALLILTILMVCGACAAVGFVVYRVKASKAGSGSGMASKDENRKKSAEKAPETDKAADVGMDEIPTAFALSESVGDEKMTQVDKGMKSHNKTHKPRSMAAKWGNDAGTDE